MIGIVDYGLGNIAAFSNVYRRLNIKAKICSSSNDLKNVTRVLLPGVGSFDEAVGLLEHSGMREAIDELVLVKEAPVLGICVGMQIMAKSSEEGVAHGLGWVDAIVRKLGKGRSDTRLALPHMGWNSVVTKGGNGLFESMSERPEFYFLHSFYVDCAREEDVIAEVEYGSRFACALCVGNVYGVQFHPEKSHESGINLLKNFGEI